MGFFESIIVYYLELEAIKDANGKSCIVHRDDVRPIIIKHAASLFHLISSLWQGNCFA